MLLVWPSSDPTSTGTPPETLWGLRLEREPAPVASIEPLTPPALDRLVRKCLAKEPDARWQTASDVADELRWLASVFGAVTAVGTAAVGVPGRRPSWRELFTFGAALFGGVVGGLLLGGATLSRPEPAGMPMRLAVTLPSDMPLAPAGLVSPGHDRPAIALSLDGTRLAYVAVVGARTQICVRDMRTGAVAPLQDTEGGHTPFFSPDGRWLGFFAHNKLKKIALSGGSAIPLADAPSPWGASWAADDTIYFNRYEGEGIWAVSANTGPVSPISTRGRMPEVVEGDSRLIVGGISRVDLAKREKAVEPAPILEGNRGRYLPTGHLLYSSGGKLMAVPFDRSTFAPTGDPVTLFEDVRWANYNVAQFTVSHQGTLVYAPGRSQGLASFVWVDRKGNQEPLDLPEAEYGPYALSRTASALPMARMGRSSSGIWRGERARCSLPGLPPELRPGINTRVGLRTARSSCTSPWTRRRIASWRDRSIEACPRPRCGPTRAERCSIRPGFRRTDRCSVSSPRARTRALTCTSSG